jgi:hydrogenase maturation protease
MRVLVLAWGNPARQDDGLGPALAQAVEDWDLPGVTLSCDYQLQVEDAVVVAEHDAVIFVDAATEGPPPYSFGPVRPCEHPGFSSHSLRPDALLAMTERCFGRSVPGWLLAIRGQSFAPFVEDLTPSARENLEAALGFLRGLLDGERGALEASPLSPL